MAKNVVIVGSPAKAKTVEKFLGKDYKVVSNYGHIADLPSNGLGVDIGRGFKPHYLISNDKKKLVKDLKTLTSAAETVWLASDKDRKEEAIMWHLSETLKLKTENTKRIVFNSITKSAVEHTIKHPHGIDYNLINAQRTHHVLDRLVGHELSPVLWKKMKSRLSTGRVQSVAVHLVVERERETQDFKSHSTYKITAELITSKGKVVKTSLSKTFNSRAEAEVFLQQDVDTQFKVASLEKKPTKKSPAPPFTTFTLQQETARKLHFSVNKTITIAQRLYESGFIAYVRTDGANLSSEALNTAKNAILQLLGESYSQMRNSATKSKEAQGTHEAIRPTDMSHPIIAAKPDQNKLCELIWKRTLVSQIADAQLERTTVKIVAGKHAEQFVATGEMIQFDGFLKVYLESSDDEDEEQEGMLPSFKRGEPLTDRSIAAAQRFNRPQPRCTEASLVKKLEELGIGRPPTYAPAIPTIQNRGYVKRNALEGRVRYYEQLILQRGIIKARTLSGRVEADKGKLIPTDIGSVISDFLVSHFEAMTNYNFTIRTENNFDQIAEGTENWTEMLADFYSHFHLIVENVEKSTGRRTGKRVLGTDPRSGCPSGVRLDKYGTVARIDNPGDAEKPIHASLLGGMSIEVITFEETLKLFELPHQLGTMDGKNVKVNVGRFKPYIHYGDAFISFIKGEDVLNVTFERTQELVNEKKKANAPIATYDGMEVIEGVGRFGSFIKWNDMYINVAKKYDFDRLTAEEVTELIENKLRKESGKVIKQWDEGEIRIERVRWGRFTLIKSKTKVELDRDTNIETFTKERALAPLAEEEPKKKKK